MSLFEDQRALHVLAAGAVAAAGVALVTSYNTTLPTRRPRAAASHAEALPRAPTYTQERERHHDNRTRHAGNLAAMAASPPELADAGAVTDELRALALTTRALRRAYDGAPPTVPHPVAQRAWPNCLACHGEGLRVATQTAPMICHATMQSCTQCHVPANTPVPGGVSDDRSPGNTFAGLEAPARGERAWPGAPPTIPHPTLMRARCVSCHGPLALGLRSPHPWRESCTQCHAPSATLDQRPTLAVAP